MTKYNEIKWEKNLEECREKFSGIIVMLFPFVFPKVDTTKTR